MSENSPPEIATRVARAYWDEHGFCGHRVYADLLGRTSTSGLIVLALTGKRLSDEECAFVDEIFVAVTFADPRIWPLKAARIVGAYGRFVPAFAAGYLANDIDGVGIGPGVCTAVSRQLIELRQSVHDRVDDADAVDEALRRQWTPESRWPGFGVAFRAEDERALALRRCVLARGRNTGMYWRLFESMVPIVRRERKLEPNICSPLAAILLDMGFDPGTVGALAMISFIGTFLANAKEGAAEPAACLRELPVGSVEYVGRPARESPRAMARRSGG